MRQSHFTKVTFKKGNDILIQHTTLNVRWRMQAFILGISNGAVCIAYCAPVLVPYLFGEGRGVLRNFVVVAQFLSGRLLGYLAFGVIAWVIGQSMLQTSVLRESIIGSAYIILSVLLIRYGFFKVRTNCIPEQINGHFQRIKTWRPFFLPAVIGLVTGLNLCPPFLLAFTNAVYQGSLLQSITFFFMFFLGTSIFFVPVPLIGYLQRYTILTTIGKLATGLMGIYYFYSGLIMIINAIAIV